MAHLGFAMAVLPWVGSPRPAACCFRARRRRSLWVLLLLGWSRELVLCTDGPSHLGEKERRLLAEQDIPLREERIERVEGEPGAPVRITFARGDALMRRAIFVHAPSASAACSPSVSAAPSPGGERSAPTKTTTPASPATTRTATRGGSGIRRSS